MKTKKKRNQNHKRLSYKFILSFFVPFLIGTILSIIVVVILFYSSHKIINKDNQLTQIIREKEFKKTVPLILSGVYKISSVFQIYFDNIANLADFYISNKKNLINSKINKTEKLKIINKFCFNGVNKDEINNFHDLYIKKGKNYEYLLTQIKWFVDKDKKEISEDDEELIQQLYLIINTLPLLKTIIETTNEYYENYEESNLISIMFSKSELFLTYPIIYNYINGEDLTTYTHLADCKTRTGSFPHFYYFKCRPYYSSLLNAVAKNKNITISDIYNFDDGNMGMTICIQINDGEEQISFCHDLELSQIENQLNSINNKVPGYLFLLKVGSEIPVYYPTVFKKEYRKIINMEFSTNNEYYDDEISLFSKNLSTFISEYEYNNSNEKILSLAISKNNEKFNYTIYPIYFNLKNLSEPQHLLTLIYVDPFEKENRYYYVFTTLCISFVYFSMGFFLILLSRYLISSIGDNIVRPIKIIKDLLEEDFDISTIPKPEDQEISKKIEDSNLKNQYNTNNLNAIQSNNINEISEKIQISSSQNVFNFTSTFGDKDKLYSMMTISQDNNTNDIMRKSTKNNLEFTTTNNIIFENTNTLSGKNIKFQNIINPESKIANMPQLLKKDDSSSSDEESSSLDNEDEVDKTRYRSNNIQKLFVKLVDLKNAYKFLEKNKLKEDAISEFVHSQNIFSEVNNYEASSICESNLSSLFINKEQYDKAICHLINGIKDIHKKIFPNIQSKRVSRLKDNSVKIDELKKKIKNENLLNRYLKLFFCYKQYFKIIKNKFHYGHCQDLTKDSFYISHHMKMYKLFLNEYIKLTRQYYGGKDLCVGLLMQLDEKISFEIPSSLDISTNKELNNNEFYSYYNNNKSNSDNLITDKQKIITEIIEIFKEVDELNKNRVYLNNYNIIHLLNLLKYDADVVNAMDIPPSILIQETNYLKGKFYLKCFDYQKSILHFEKVIDFGKIGDAKYLMKAYKYLIKISNTYLDLVKNDIEFHSHQIKYKNELEDDKKRKDALEKYINDLNNEIRKYIYIPKDICIIVNIGNITSQTNDLTINEKTLNIKKILTNICSNIVTSKDKISILEYKNNECRFLVTRKSKSETNESKIESILENIENFLISSLQTVQNNSSSVNCSTNAGVVGGGKSSLRYVTPAILEKLRDDRNANCLFNSLEYCLNYLKMKQMDNNGTKCNTFENWFLFVTCDFSFEDINTIKQKPLDKILFIDDKKKCNLVIIFYENFSQDKKNLLNEWIKFNRSAMLSKDELGKLKEILGTKGEEQKTRFDLEKYKENL